MSSYTLKINGTTHRVTLHSDGTKTYDPPLEDEGKWKGRFKQMVSSGQAPSCVTDSTFLAGVGTLEKQFEGDPEGLARVVENAKAMGYTPSPYDFYQPGLADVEGSPKAFCKTRGEVRERCIERGVPCSGSVNVGEHEVAPRPERAKKKRKRLADDIVNRKLQERLADNPSLNVADTKADIIETHGAKHAD